jgi:two-component system OmpR family response regulator
MRILLIEDDRRTAEYVVRGFEERGHQCETLPDGQNALYQATHDSYDVLIVDRMLPGLDGLALVRALRTAGTMTPVLFLTAMSGVDGRRCSLARLRGAGQP